MEIPRRRLPHWYPEACALFVTWHLHGSLPKCRYPPPGHPSAGRAFVWMDRYLDTTRSGPMWLRRPDVAALVKAHILRGAEERLYELHAWVVMANHVHLLVRPLIKSSEALRRIKGRSAREANLTLCRTGEPFWQAESYDHWVLECGRGGPDYALHRKQSAHRWLGESSGGLSLVKCLGRVEQASACNGGFSLRLRIET